MLHINRKQWGLLALPALSLALGITALELIGTRSSARQEQPAPPVQPSIQSVGLQNDFENVSRALGPSVVSITSQEPVKPGAINGLPFQFNLPIPNMPLPGQGGVIPQQGAPQFQQYNVASGSGMIVRSDGYILTNDHVVANATKVTVTLQNGEKFPGTVYRDKLDDLAIVKINATNLPVVQFANSHDTKVGQWAIAFGSPFDLKNTMTVGVISSLNREITVGQRLYPDVLQTDASINPGNSGGPLVDIYGRVVGVDVAIESPSGGNVGIGFAIPANTAKYIANQLIENGKVVRGYLGVVPAPITYADQKRYGVTSGALIEGVMDDSPAAKAGMQVQDVVTSFDNKPVLSEPDFRNLIARAKPGQTVPVVVQRSGASVNLTVTLGDMPDNASQGAVPPAAQHTKGRLGVDIKDLDANTQRQFNLPNSVQKGAVISEVYPGSPAADAGMAPGDVVVSVNGKPINSAQQLADAVSALPKNSSVTVIVRRLMKTVTGGSGMETLLMRIHLVN